MAVTETMWVGCRQKYRPVTKDVVTCRNSGAERSRMKLDVGKLRPWCQRSFTFILLEYSVPKLTLDFISTFIVSAK